MYTIEQSEELGPSYWDILDPEGDVVVTVEGQEQAEALLSHLNR